MVKNRSEFWYYFRLLLETQSKNIYFAGKPRNVRFRENIFVLGMCLFELFDSTLYFKTKFLLFSPIRLSTFKFHLKIENTELPKMYVSYDFQIMTMYFDHFMNLT